MGGRGASSSKAKSTKSSLEAFRSNARQFNEALQKAKQQRASIVEYTDITGQTFKRYWNGASFVDRESALYEKERKGLYKAKYRD